MDKEALRRANPLLFILQGFSSVPMLGPAACPVECLDMVAKTNTQPFVPSAGECYAIGTAGAF